MKRKNKFRGLLLIAALLTLNCVVSAQTNAIYEQLPVGKYSVGFKIFTLTDDSRITKPEFNYLGEKNEGDRRRKITIHLWYPAETTSTATRLKYEDYCY